VRGLAIEAAYVTLGITGVGKFVSNVSYVIASVALGITVVIEGVKTFPRSDKSDRLRGCIGIKVPSTSVRKGPAKEFVTVLYGRYRLAYESTDVNSDVVELRAVIRVKGDGHLIAFRRATDGNRTNDSYQGE
jgi:hypothetical protein